MNGKLVNQNLLQASFKVWEQSEPDLPDEMAEAKAQFEAYGFKKL